MLKVYYSRYKLATAICSLIIPLGIGELFLRTWSPQRTITQLKRQQLACYQSSQYLPYELKPFCRGEYLTGGIDSHVRINSIGIRGIELEENSKKRILLIGDSFVFGYGVEEDQNIGSKLAELSGEEAVNGGVWGFGPDAEFLMAKRLIPEVKPGAIILMLFPANDLRDLAETDWTIDQNERLIRVANDKFVDSEGFLRRDAVSHRYYIPILNESHLAALVIDGVESGISRLRGWFSRFRGIPIKRLEGPRIKDFDNGGDIDCLYENHCIGLWSKARDKAENIFHRFYDLSQQYSLPIFIVAIPSESQLNGVYPEITIFHRLSEEFGFPLLDLAEGLKSSGYPVSELYLKDGHWSPLGNKVVGEEIFKRFFRNPEKVNYGR